MIIRLIETILIAVACVIMFTCVVNDTQARHGWTPKVKTCVLRVTYVLTVIAIACMITVGITSMI